MRRPGIKSKSSRQTLHQKHKIERKVREHNKKQRSALKKGQSLNKGSRFTKRTRDPGIPNNCPFRDEVLKEAQAFKEKQEIEKEEMKKKQQKWQQLQYKRKQMGFSSVEEMLEKAETDKKKHEQKERERIGEMKDGNGADINSDLAKGKKESQNFWRQVNQVINDADVILHILDARDPEGTRCKQIEKAVALKDDKKLVLVLNKIDLIPVEAAKAWLKFYRRTMGPTITFKAATQHQKSNISQKGSGGKMAKEVSGTGAMLNFLANYGRLESEDKTSKVRTAVTVGVVGLPNVGKSSIINTLKRNRSCQVGAQPGVTRNLQTVQIDSHVKLIDSPGVVLESKDRDSIVGKVLLHALNVGSAENSREAALEILKRVGDLEKLAFFYQLELDSKIIGNNPEHFLACLARRKGWLKKGARPDTNAACKFLLKQWTSGSLNFHTLPPALEDSPNQKDDLTLHSSLSKHGAKIKPFLEEELDLDFLLNDQDSQSQDITMEAAAEAHRKLETTILFKAPENRQIEYKVDLKGSRKRKVNFEEMGDGQELSSTSTAEKTKTSSSKNSENKPTPDPNLKHLGQAPEVDDFETNFTDKNKKKMLKKRKKMLKRSNMEMEPIVDDLANLMGNA